MHYHPVSKRVLPCCSSLRNKMPPFRLLKDKFKQHKEKRADQHRKGSSSPATETDQVSTPVVLPLTEPAKLTCTSERAGPSDPQSLKDRDLSSKSPDIWKSAYDKFREDEHDLLEDYDKHVFGAGTVNACPGREAIETALTQLQVDRENKQWRISVLNRDIKIRVQVERVVHVLKWSDPLVKSALSTQPYAALAWSGVSLLLPLLANSATHNEAMLEGLGSIGELQEFWEAQEKTSLRSDRQQHYKDLIEPLVKLYSLFFAYQAHVISRLSKTQTSRAWKGVTGPTFWTDKLDKINKVSEHCCRLIGVSREGDSQARRDNLQLEVERSRKAQEDMLASMKLQREEKKETQLLKDLAEVAGDYERYKNLNPTRVPGTCEWLLMDERFCNWRENASSSLLWVSAGPGLGKSVLSKSLIDEGPLAITTMTITPSSNEPTTSTQSTVCYFFFKDGGAGLMDSAQALCALLHQLFIRPSTTGLIKYALEKHKEHGRSLTEKVHELWRILSACATAPDTGEIICVLDALDECKEDSRAELFRILEEFYSKSARLSTENSKLKFLITSRPYDDLETSFRAFPDAVCLRFDGDDKSEEIRKEIDLVIDARVPDITKDFAPKDQQTISEHLKSMQHRTYLWLHLTLNMIEQSPNEYGRRCDVEKLLSGLPSRVSDAYEKILSRSKVQSRTRALLHILLAATRPLTLDEANIALVLAIEEQEPNSHAQIESSLMWPKKNFRSIVTNLCGLFVTVYDSKLSFIHQTAREFLLDSKQEGNWKGSFTMLQSHSTVSRSCLLYLLLPDINGPTEDGDSSQYPYLTYAAHSWPVHFVSQKSADANTFRKHARRLCETRHQAKIWAPSYFKKKSRRYDGWSDLTLASYFGFSEVVEDILCQE
ncbi:hypothetical protein BKA61DRAFT_551586, partial [Leptodontidium sp. MPI-SDFR-AT-0119]